MIDNGFGVKGVLENNGQILVLFKNDGTLDLPGGRVNAGESFDDALIRESREETNLDIRIFEVLAQWSFTKNNGLYVTGLTYECQVLSGQIAISPEHRHFQYFDRDEIPNLISLNRFL